MEDKWSKTIEQKAFSENANENDKAKNKEKKDNYKEGKRANATTGQKHQKMKQKQK